MAAGRDAATVAGGSAEHVAANADGDVVAAEALASPPDCNALAEKADDSAACFPDMPDVPDVADAP
eukprot:880284-Alexandrium_andersonii.AAC.1